MINNDETQKIDTSHYSTEDIVKMLSLYSEDSEGGKRKVASKLELSKLKHIFEGKEEYFGSPKDFKSPFEKELKQET